MIHRDGELACDSMRSIVCKGARDIIEWINGIDNRLDRFGFDLSAKGCEVTCVRRNKDCVARLLAKWIEQRTETGAKQFNDIDVRAARFELMTDCAKAAMTNDVKPHVKLIIARQEVTALVVDYMIATELISQPFIRPAADAGHVSTKGFG